MPEYFTRSYVFSDFIYYFNYSTMCTLAFAHDSNSTDLELLSSAIPSQTYVLEMYTDSSCTVARVNPTVYNSRTILKSITRKLDNG